jgi:hypothetical protein
VIGIIRSPNAVFNAVESRPELPQCHRKGVVQQFYLWVKTLPGKWLSEPPDRGLLYGRETDVRYPDRACDVAVKFLAGGPGHSHDE